MNRTLAVAFVVLALPTAVMAQGLRDGKVPTTDVQGCVGGQNVNNHTIRQNSDINMAACIQAGRQNTATIEQDGDRNTARIGQGQTRSRR